MKKTMLGLLASVCLLGMVGMAKAVIVMEGITYTASSANGDTGTLSALIHIENINGLLDTRDGRYGVESFAFNNTGLLGGTLTGASAGFTFLDGGLNSGGCNGSGEFFCFSAVVDPTAPPLPAETQLNIFFSLSVTEGNFLAWLASDPHFKINWLGTENNYDLVSLGGSGVGINPLCVTPGGCDPSVVPIPGAVWLFGTIVAMVGGMRQLFRLRRRRVSHTMVAAA